MPRPKLAPIRIPRWAWRLNKWLATRPRLRGRRPGPRRLPRWFWLWRRWVRSAHPEPRPITMYDSVDVSQIPTDADAVAGYVGGHWPTFPTLERRFSHAHLLSIAVNAEENAEALDIENGDARPEQAPSWVRRQLARGVKRPVVYSSVSQMATVLEELRRAGIERSQVRIWTAHYTMKPHRCGPECGFGFHDRADATQYSDHALERNLDASLCSSSFFA